MRVGVHTGTPLLTDEGYVGDDVHFAARVAATSHGGQVVLSAATAELVDVELTDLGEHRLKDIGERSRSSSSEDGFFPPLKTISNTNLPRPASSFVGQRGRGARPCSRRIEARRAPRHADRAPAAPARPRLAIEAASTLVPEYKAGVFWVGLASLRDPALVTDSTRAGRLWGAIEAQEARGSLGIWEQQRDELVAPVLAVSGAEFERGRVAGSRLTLDEAVEYALASID